MVPVEWRPRIFAVLHSLAHPGIRATRRLMSARFCWCGLAKDVGTWCRECVQCQRAKITKQPTAPVRPIPVPARRFSHIHVDLVGPLPASKEGFSYLLTIIDRSTRWVEAAPMHSISAVDCADALVATWIARYGVPAQLTSDRGVQFSSAVWKILCERLDIVHHLTTAYHY